MTKKIFTLLTALVLCSSMSWAWYWGDNADYAYSSCSVSRENSAVFKLSASKVQATSCLDFSTTFYFAKGNDVDYIPTGYYSIVETPDDQPYTKGTALGDYGTSFHKVTDWCSGGGATYNDWIKSGTIFVYNPNNSTPTYVLANFTTHHSWERVVIIGTEPASYSVIFHVEPDANGNTFEESAPSCADDNCTKFYPGTEIQLYPKPAEGYIFSSWTGDGSEDIQYNVEGDYYYFIVGTKSYEITPVFELATAGKITTAVNDETMGYVTGGGSYDGGTRVDLTAIAYTGYVFKEWDDNIIDNPRNIIANGDATYTAIFVPAITITANTNNSQMGSISGGGAFAEGTNITLTANPNSDYRVQKWQKNGVDIIGETGNTLNIIVGNTNATYTVVFEEIPAIVITDGLVERFNYNWGDNYFRITGTASDGTYVRIETGSAWKTGDISNIIDESDNHYYTYCNKFTMRTGGHSVIIEPDQDDKFKFVVRATLYDTDNNAHNFIISCSYSFTESNDCSISLPSGKQYFDVKNSANTKIMFESKKGTRNFKVGSYSRSECNSVNGNSYVNNNNAYIEADVVQIDATHYTMYVYTWAQSKMYFYKLNITKGFDNDSKKSVTETFDATEIKAVSKVGDNTLALWHEHLVLRGTYIYDLYEEYNTYLKFVVDDAAYKAGIIPSGTYNIQGNATNSVIPGDGSTCTTTPEGWTGIYLDNASKIPSASSYRWYYNYNDSKELYYLCKGNVEVLNPNQGIPTYVKVSATNSHNYTINVTIGTKSLYEVSFISTTDFGTATMTCAEGHGYTTQGIESSATGNYYYAGTILTLTAPAATGNYEFKGWSNNGTLIPNSNVSPYQYTVGSSNNLKAVYGLKTRQVTIDTPTNGSIVVTDGSGNVISNGDMVEYGTVLTVTATNATGYHFVAWTTGTGYVTPNANGQVTVTSDIKLGATFAIDTYTLTMDACENGTYSVTYGGQTQYTGSAKQTFDIDYGTQVTLTANHAEGYEFAGWVKVSEEPMPDDGAGAPRRAVMEGIGGGSGIGGGPSGTGTYVSTDVTYPFIMTDNVEYRADFKVLSYDVTIEACEHGTIRVEQVGKTQPLYEGAAGTMLTIPYNTELTITAIADTENHYEFKSWTGDGAASVTVDGEKTIGVTFGKEQVTFTVAATNGSINITDAQKNVIEANSNSYTVDYGTVVFIKAQANTGYYFDKWNDEETENPYEKEVTSAFDLTATFAANFVLIDNKPEGDAWYETFAEMVGVCEEKPISVTFERTFTAGNWTVFSLPFIYSFLKPENQTFRDQVYEFDNAMYDEGYLQLNFIRQNAYIEANKPYLLHPFSTITNPIFENVRLVEIEDATYEASLNGTDHQVKLINTTHYTTLPVDKNIIFLNQNTLYYPSKPQPFRAFRGYFNLGMTEEEIKHAPKIRIVVDGEEVMNLEDEAAEEFIKKYFDNEGNLIIENNGVKYDAKGQQL